MTVNLYTIDGTFLNKKKMSSLPQVGTDITVENPSGLIYSGSVVSAKIDLRFETEYAVILNGKWEWES